jgi:hypothetical protein
VQRYYALASAGHADEALALWSPTQGQLYARDDAQLFRTAPWPTGYSTRVADETATGDPLAGAATVEVDLPTPIDWGDANTGVSRVSTLYVYLSRTAAGKWVITDISDFFS